MSLHIASELMSAVEPVLLAATLCVFAKASGLRRFPAFGAYLICRLAVCASLVGLLYAADFSLIEKHAAYRVSYYAYWLGCLASAGTALLAIHEIFRHIMRTLPGLGRYGLIAFRWVALTSALVALALASAGQERNFLVAATSGAMRCASVLELCLLVFIVVSMQALSISPRSREFGLALGFGMIAAADLFGSAFSFGHAAIASAGTPMANYAAQGIVNAAAAVWIVYWWRPLAITVSLPGPSSSLQRWNEIAAALADSAPPQIALSASSGFFLQDVERAVDRVLEKNPVNPA
jgi:hypothetical protein